VTPVLVHRHTFSLREVVELLLDGGCDAAVWRRIDSKYRLWLEGHDVDLDEE
jgi:hypothetical protein